MNKSVILALVLLIAALTPATAIIGFCARMPCCEAGETAGSHHEPGLTTQSASCCTSINCYEATDREASSASLGKALTGATSTLAIVPVVRVSLPAAAQFSDTSPPRPSRERLSILSTLLI